MDSPYGTVRESTMKVKITTSAIYIFACILSGAIGAYSMRALQGSDTNRGTLQTHRLELIDARKNVRAVLSVDDDGSVFLRMLSRKSVPIVELGVNGNDGPQQIPIPSGQLTIRDKTGKPSVQLRSFDNGEGSLLFAGPNTQEQVAVGYSHYDDVIDGHDRGKWGITIVGPDHKLAGIGVFAKDGILQGFTIPLEAPRPTTPR